MRPLKKQQKSNYFTAINSGLGLNITVSLFGDQRQKCEADQYSNCIRLCKIINLATPHG